MNIHQLSLILLVSFFLVGSQAVSSQTKTGNLPVIDFSKTFPKKEVRLQDIADIEYIPLETTDDILLSGMASLSYVSDKYILIHEFMQGDIFVFNRNGQLYSHFNHKGQSGQEYLWMAGGTVFDEKNQEIFVCSQAIQVYSLKGEYKRTLKVNTIVNEMKVLNFDDNTLLLYEDIIIDPDVKSKTKTKPYSLISKKDGSVVAILDIHIPKRYSITSIARTDDKKWQSIKLFFPSNLLHGQDFMIADISSDTLFLLSRNRELTPLLTRKPSVHASEPRKIWTITLTTDKFMLIGLITLDFKSKGGQIPTLMYAFETGETSNISILDADDGMRKWRSDKSPTIAKNTTAELVQTSSLIKAYNKKQLKGDVEKLAKTLTEDDNPVVRIIKFK